MKPPSTAWRGDVAPDEAERFARYAEQFAELQRRRSERYGAGRALHRKQLLGLEAEDASVDRPEAEAPCVTVARLTIPKQPLDDDVDRHEGTFVRRSKSRGAARVAST